MEDDEIIAEAEEALNEFLKEMFQAIGFLFTSAHDDAEEHMNAIGDPDNLADMLQKAYVNGFVDALATARDRFTKQSELVEELGFRTLQEMYDVGMG